MFISTLSICYNNTWSSVTTTAVLYMWFCVLNASVEYVSLCSLCIWSFMSIHIISQATDEVPMMQQQSVQQQKAAPGVGFQPWVQRRTSHPSLSLLSPFSLFQPLHWPPHMLPSLLFVLFVCVGPGVSVQFLLVFDQPSIIFFFAGNVWNGYSWLIGLYFLLLSLISLEHTLVFPLVHFFDDRSRGKLDAWVFRLT